MEGVNAFDSLPNEIIVCGLLSYIAPKDILFLGATDLRLRTLSRDPRTWEKRCRRDLKHPSALTALVQTQPDWCVLYGHHASRKPVPIHLHRLADEIFTRSSNLAGSPSRFVVTIVDRVSECGLSIKITLLNILHRKMHRNLTVGRAEQGGLGYVRNEHHEALRRRSTWVALQRVREPDIITVLEPDLLTVRDPGTISSQGVILCKEPDAGRRAILHRGLSDTALGAWHLEDFHYWMKDLNTFEALCVLPCEPRKVWRLALFIPPPSCRTLSLGAGP